MNRVALDDAVPRNTALMLRFLIGLLSAALLVLAWMRITALEPVREDGFLPIEPPTPYIRYIPDIEPRTRVLVVHGLNANKEFMQILCAALADSGFEVYNIDLPGHGDSPAGFNGVLARRTLEQAVSRLNPDAAIGHSLGAGLLLDLAHDVHFRALVLISPAPTPIDNVDLRHTLVTTGRWDIPAVNSFVPRLQGAEWRQYKWGMHSSAPLNPVQIRDIVHWLGGETTRLRTGSRMAWLGLMFSTAFVLGITLLPRRTAQRVSAAFSAKEVILAFILACGIAIVVLRFFLVLRSIRLFATDYLVSFLFVAGLVLMAVAVSRKDSLLSLLKGRPGHSIAIAVAAAVYVILIIGLLTGSHLIHMTVSDGRWWRCPVIAAATFPLFLFDEIATRHVGNGWEHAALGILTRALLAASTATGVLILNRHDSFLVLILGLIVLFWIALWLCTELVSRRVQNPIAAALFAALVQGWMFAAWFVTV